MSQGFTNQQTYAVLPPTIQKFTSGSGTYTLPSGAKYIVVQMCGGGGGGGGSSSDTTGGTGGTGGNSTFGTSLLTANGGVGGGNANPSQGGAGGTASLNSPAIGYAYSGQSGMGAEAQAPYSINHQSGSGGNSLFNGAGAAVTSSSSPVAGLSAIANTGGGGGGASKSDNSAFCGAGGGGGGYLFAIISSPSSTYSYSVGAGGTAGTAGTGGSAGGAGSAGIIIVTEYYDTIGIPSNLTLPVPVNQGGTGVTTSTGTGSVVLSTNPTIDGSTLKQTATNTTFTGSTALSQTFVPYQTNYNELSGYDFFEGAPFARIAAYKTSGGSFIKMGTSNNYGSGITNTGLIINQAGSVSILGTITNDNASAGYVGEEINSSGTVTVSSNVYTNITSISLTAGDWDVWGNMLYASSANATTQFAGWISVTSASYPGNSVSSVLSFNSGTTMTSGQAFTVPYRRYSLNTTTTIYLTGVAVFSSGTGSIEGRINARRAR